MTIKSVYAARDAILRTGTVCVGTPEARARVLAVLAVFEIVTYSGSLAAPAWIEFSASRDNWRKGAAIHNAAARVAA